MDELVHSLIHRVASTRIKLVDAQRMLKEFNDTHYKLHRKYDVVKKALEELDSEITQVSVLIDEIEKSKKSAVALEKAV